MKRTIYIAEFLFSGVRLRSRASRRPTRIHSSQKAPHLRSIIIVLAAVIIRLDVATVIAAFRLTSTFFSQHPLSVRYDRVHIFIILYFFEFVNFRRLLIEIRDIKDSVKRSLELEWANKAEP